ncbi:hypothetical protein [Streptomyces halobius]|uniref:hypothetical protein n=1 Tax=Streptomyces halobius TaxID=2879846 RepID=UPI0038730B0E
MFSRFRRRKDEALTEEASAAAVTAEPEAPEPGASAGAAEDTGGTAEDTAGTAASSEGATVPEAADTGADTGSDEPDTDQDGAAAGQDAPCAEAAAEGPGIPRQKSGGTAAGSEAGEGARK